MAALHYNAAREGRSGVVEVLLQAKVLCLNETFVGV